MNGGGKHGRVLLLEGMIDGDGDIFGESLPRVLLLLDEI